MKKDAKIGVIGGDARQIAAAEELAKVGYEVALYGFDRYFDSDECVKKRTADADEASPTSTEMPRQDTEMTGRRHGRGGGITRCAGIDGAVSGAEAIVLPLPSTADGVHLSTPLADPEKEVTLRELFSKMTPGQVVIGGRFDHPKHSSVYALAEESGVTLVDYYRMEELSVANSIPTAEGAIAIAMNELPVTIRGCRAHVIGYGRIGRTLSSSLAGLGAKVTVYARSDSDLAWISAAGFEPIHTSRIAADATVDLPHPLSGAAVVFNTVPARLLGEGELRRIRDDCEAFSSPPPLLIDLASAPGGIDREAAEKLSLRTIWALSLPGRVAPVTSGRLIAACVRKVLRQER